MEMMYFVSYYRHNGTSDSWAYKTEFGTKNIGEAEKKYHTLMADYIGGTTFDFVTVMIVDMYGNIIECGNWAKTE